MAGCPDDRRYRRREGRGRGRRGSRRRRGCDLPRASRGGARWRRCAGRCAGEAAASAGQRRRPWRAGQWRAAPGAVDREHPAGQADPVGLQGGQVEPPVIGPADELQRWLVPGEQAVGHLVDRRVECADPVEPPEDVHAAVAARHAGVSADGDVTSRPAARSSSASWTPVAEAPTTSTPPSGSEPGLRYSPGLAVGRPREGRAPPPAPRAGRTSRWRSSRWRRARPPGRCRPRSRGPACAAGARPSAPRPARRTTRAYGVRNAATSAADMNPSGRGRGRPRPARCSSSWG